LKKNYRKYPQRSSANSAVKYKDLFSDQLAAHRPAAALPALRSLEGEVVTPETSDFF
jgi:hypothetical protein